MLQAILQSPHFLYRVELGAPNPSSGDVVLLSDHEIAARLSYFLWGSMPDDTLRAAAIAGELRTKAQIRAHAERMLADDRAVDSISHFAEQWLELVSLVETNKDPVLYPEFNELVRASMLQATIQFHNHVVLESAEGTLDELFTASYHFANQYTAPLLGVFASGRSLERVELDPQQRAGVLTDPGILSAHAKFNQTSPVHRGKFVREQLLCQPLPNPPDNVEIVLPEVSPDATTRERFTQHMTDPSCAGCHALMDPIGFGFEHYDAIGRWRDRENDLDIDASGTIIGYIGGDRDYDGALELAGLLAESELTRKCVAQQWFRYALGRVEGRDDNCSIDGVLEAFAAGGYRVKDLIIAITQTDAFTYRRTIEAEECL